MFNVAVRLFPADENEGVCSLQMQTAGRGNRKYYNSDFCGELSFRSILLTTSKISL